MRFVSIFACFVLLLGCSSGGPGETKVAAAGKPAATKPEASKPAPQAARPDLNTGEEPAVRPAKALEFRTADGKQISLADYKGRVVVVMFFSTDCPHCQQTTAFLSTIYDQYAAKGTEFIGLAVNPNAPGNIDQFISTYRARFPVGLTTRSTWSEFGEFPITQNTFVPHMLFVDKAGNIAEDHPGKDRDFWATQQTGIPAALDRLLAQ